MSRTAWGEIELEKPEKVLILGSGALKIGEAGSSTTPAPRRSRR